MTHGNVSFFFFEGFAWATDLSTDLESQLSVSCKCYEAANEILQFSDLKSQNPEHYVQVLKRMGNVRNEIGVFYMNQAAALQSERVGEYLFGVLSLLPVLLENPADVTWFNQRTVARDFM